MDNAEMPDVDKGVTFEEIRAILRDVAEQQKETDRQMKETDRQMKETERKISKLGGRFGEMIESMVVPGLAEKFRQLGFIFEKTCRDTEIKDTRNNIYTEIDITLENGDKVMIVEVKSKPSIGDVKDHVERMGKVRRHADYKHDKRTYLGALAGMVMPENVRDYIHKNGFYALEPAGDTFDIFPPEIVREW